MYLSFQTLLDFSESSSVLLLLIRTLESACKDNDYISFIAYLEAPFFNYLSSSLVHVSSIGDAFKASSIAKFASTNFPPSSS